MNNKPMSMGQRALYDIAVDPERARNFLINLAGLKADARQRNIYTGAIILLAFVVGFLLGKV